MGHQADRGFRSLDPSTLNDSQYPDAQAQELSFARPSVWKRPTDQEFFSARENRMAEIRPTQANVSLVNTMSFWAMPAIAPLNPHPQPRILGRHYHRVNEDSPHELWNNPSLPVTY